MRKTKWIICPTCEGHCKVGHPAMANGFTSSEWNEMHEDEQHAYMQGEYDVPCGTCKATGKIEIPDVARMTFSEKRKLVIERREDRAEARFARELRAELAAERALGC
ncbi:hypothetical protein [Pseudomonas sp.]|uniref:hypothetical protein n=1 Tax=Pseudomonas sp. TaxID=306 RepID=UPI00290ED6ED|nr:hypothetical protein [Pseudomonas sp.]MDU4254585.1 hypothetical protein [Pseudomonas sp.]